MLIGLPKEVKDNEYRVALTPGGAKQLVDAGHQIMMETGAGVGSGFLDEAYKAVGAKLSPKAADAWSAELVVKVKEPEPSEYPLMRPGLGLFTYLHLAPEKELTGSCRRHLYRMIERRGNQLPDWRRPWEG
jgi:alanine dehydrogenase